MSTLSSTVGWCALSMDGAESMGMFSWIWLPTLCFCLSSISAQRKVSDTSPKFELSFCSNTHYSAAVPLRILTQRSQACCCTFVAFVNMSIDTHIYYLPFYFQAVKGTSAEGSGTRILPYLVSVFTTAIVTGSFITAFGYYVPIMWLGAAILTIGCGLIHTLHVGSTEAQWFGYQVLTGIGFGMAFQIPYTAAQVVLSAEDLPMGNALIVFFQALGGALAISIGQNVLSNVLNQQLVQLPQINAASVIADGATNIASDIPPALQGPVKAAYSFALSRTYILPIAGGGAAFLCSLGMENRTVRKRERTSEKSRGKSFSDIKMETLPSNTNSTPSQDNEARDERSAARLDMKGDNDVDAIQSV